MTARVEQVRSLPIVAQGFSPAGFAALKGGATGETSKALSKALCR